MTIGNDFLWGAATSSHQIEGHTQNDWTLFEDQNRVPQRSGQGVDHWNRYEDDFRLFAQLGLNSYRFSLEWSRIEPKPGIFDQSNLARYRTMIEAMRAHGLTPVMTLFHFTLPQWLTRAGGLLHPKFPLWFVRYTNKVVGALGDLVDIIITINEPMVLVVMGYLWGQWPPGRRYRFDQGMTVMRRLVKSHRLAYQAVKKADSAIQVGLAHHFSVFEPFSPSWLNRIDASLADYLMNWRFFSQIRDLQDFIGANYYTRHRMRWQSLLVPAKNSPGDPVTDMGWDIYPQGLEQVLLALKPFKKPILITENGIATRDDKIRQQFLADHLLAVKRAQRQGAPVYGYFHWSALDNFEWAEGFRPRFGLIAVDYDTLKRSVRDSGWYYRKIIQANTPSRFPINVPPIRS